MAVRLCQFRSGFIPLNSFRLRSKALVNVKYYADDSTKKVDLYKTLGIPSSATQNEIKKAYYDLTLKYHPDRNENCEVAAIRFREVAEAYEVLGNFGLRKKYDKGIPLPQIKKTVVKSPIEHKVKYQQFFDSRVARTTSTFRSEEVEDSDANPYTKYYKEMERKFNEEVSPKKFNMTQALVALWLGTVLFLRMG